MSAPVKLSVQAELVEKLSALVDAINRVQEWGEDTRVGVALAGANMAISRAELTPEELSVETWRKDL